MAKNGRHIAVTTSTFAQFDKRPLQTLEKAGCTYTLNPHGRKLTQEEVARLAENAVGIIAGTETYDANLLTKLSSVKVIARCGTGMDNLDLKTIKKRSIAVANTPDAATLAVAELVVGLILSLLRKTPLMDRKIREKKWDKVMGHLLFGKNVGIIGYGRIGEKVASLLKPFEVKLCYYDVVKKGKTAVPYKSLSDLLKWADIICLHVSSHSGYLLDEKEFQLMKQGAWLVNCARGELVNEQILYTALKDGKLSGAALDVFQQEPYTGPLTSLDNVILTPHIGSYARESRIQMEIDAVTNLLKLLK